MLYSNQTPETTTQKDPDFYQGNNFLLGLLGYKNNGEQSTWGKALTFGAQAALGPVLGTLASKGINAVAKNQLGGAEDSLANLEQTDDKIGAAGSATSGIIQSLLPMLGGGGVPGVGSILSLLGGIGKKGGGTAAPATPAFRTGGEVSFRVGGVTVKMPKPDYKVYDDKDKAEDLLMIDIATGRPYGKMRYGERIFDQKSNLAMKYVMQSMKTEAEKKQALGNHVYDELLTHSDIKGFAGGGPVVPKKTVAQRVAEMEAELQATADPAAKRRLQVQINMFKQSQPAQTAPVTPSTGLAANPNSAANLWGTTGLPSQTGFETSMLYNLNRSSVPEAPATSPSVPGIPKPGRTAIQPPVNASKPIQLPEVTITGRIGGNSPMLAIPGINPITSRAVNGQVVPASGMFTPGAPTIPNRTITPMAPVASTGAGNAGSADGLGSFGLGAALDLSRIIAGASFASKPMPKWSITDPYRKLETEIEGRKNQGLSPEEMALANQNISGTYGAGVNALTQSVGGGANPGVVLAGLSNLGGQRAGQLSQLAAADAAARNQNFGQYATMVGQGLNLSRMQYGDDLQRAEQTRAAGLGLIQSGMQSIADRNMYNMAYGPGSMYQATQQKQIDLMNEAIQNQKAITQNTLNNAARTLAQPTVDPEAEAGKKRADFVSKLTPELRAEYAAMYPNLKF